jgi:hypothetical protein
MANSLTSTHSMDGCTNNGSHGESMRSTTSATYSRNPLWKGVWGSPRENVRTRARHLRETEREREREGEGGKGKERERHLHVMWWHPHSRSTNILHSEHRCKPSFRSVSAVSRSSRDNFSDSGKAWNALQLKPGCHDVWHFAQSTSLQPTDTKQLFHHVSLCVPNMRLSIQDARCVVFFTGHAIATYRNKTIVSSRIRVLAMCASQCRMPGLSWQECGIFYKARHSNLQRQ